MTRYALPNVPFVEASSVGERHSPTAIVLKLSGTTSDRGAALGVAQYHHKARSLHKSFHYIVDNAEIYRCVPDDIASYSNPSRAISVLICAEPHEQEAMWEDATAKPVLYHAASLVADLMLAHKINCRQLTDQEIEKWRRHKWRSRGGLIVDVVGAWPGESFMQDVWTKKAFKTELRRRS